MAEIAISKGNLKQYGDDANNIIDSGLYAYNGLEKEINNVPYKYGSLIVFNPLGQASGGWPISQLFIGIHNECYIRNRWTGEWSDWVQVTTTSVVVG